MKTGKESPDYRHPKIRARVRRAVRQGVRDASVADVRAADGRRHAAEVHPSRPGTLAPVQPGQYQLHHERPDA